jgi:hypothetical protein
MSYPKMAVLIERLISLTNRSEIRWEATAQDDVYQASLPGYSVQILTRPTVHRGVDGEDVVVRIRNNEGKVIEEVADTDFSQDLLKNSYEKMQNMYQTARRQALGVEAALDELLNALGRPDSESTKDDDDDDIPF